MDELCPTACLDKSSPTVSSVESSSTALCGLRTNRALRLAWIDVLEPGVNALSWELSIDGTDGGGFVSILVLGLSWIRDCPSCPNRQGATSDWSAVHQEERQMEEEEEEAEEDFRIQSRSVSHSSASLGRVNPRY